MPRWARGEAEVEQLIARGELERVSGAAADGIPLLEQARKTAATAAGLVSSDPYSAYVLAYDAARFACIALLAEQGLRVTTSGGHYAAEQAVRAQFGDGFRPFGILRRRRNELEYPHLPADTASSEEAEQAAGTAHGLITAAGRLVPQLAFFTQNQELGDHRSNAFRGPIADLTQAGGDASLGDVDGDRAVRGCGSGQERGRDAEDPAWGGGPGQPAAGEGGVVLVDGDRGDADVVAWPGQQPAARRGDCGVDAAGADPEQVVSG
jgi:hypothetical protein